MSATRAEGPAYYPTTHWSQIFLASQDGQVAGQGALDRLLRQYERPLLAHLRSRFAADHEQTQDLFQEFVAKKVLRKSLLKHADRERGRFRTFLLNSLDNFVIQEHRWAERARRSPSGGFVSIDDLDGAEPAMASAPKADSGDYAWAVEVIAEAQRRTKAFYEAKGHANSWAAFEEGYSQPIVDGTRAPSKAALARRLGFKSAKAVSNAITTVRRMFGKNVRAVVREYETVENGAIEGEIRDLKAILARGP